MKKYLLGLLLLLPAISTGYGQAETDPTVSKCLLTTGQSAKYLKDFRIQLGIGTKGDQYRYKANMSLWKNTRYRFTMCTADGSSGNLVLKIYDDANKPVLSSLDPETGNTYSYVDLVCNKSGIYHIYYDFTEARSGSGVSIVSLVQ